MSVCNEKLEGNAPMGQDVSVGSTGLHYIPTLLAMRAAAAMGKGSADSDWDPWVQQYNRQGTCSITAAAGAVRQTSPALRDAIDQQVVSILAVIDPADHSGYFNPALGVNPYVNLHVKHLKLSRFPSLARLGLDLRWDVFVHGAEMDQCILDLEGLPSGVHDLRIKALPPRDGVCHVGLNLQPQLQLPPLHTLELVNFELPFEDLPLHLLPGLQRLRLMGCELQLGEDVLSLDISHTPKLQHLECAVPNMTKLELVPLGGQDHTALQHLDVSRSRNLLSLNTSYVQYLTYLVCAGCTSLIQLVLLPQPLQHLDLSGLGLDGFNVSFCADTLQHLNLNGFEGWLAGLSACTALQELHWTGCPTESLDLQALTSLRKLDVSDSQLRSDDGSEWSESLLLPPSLQALNCSGCKNLQILCAAELTSLTELDCSHSGIKQLVLPEMGDNAQLVRLDCAHTPITELDLLGVPLLEQLNVRSCSHLSQVALAGPKLKRLQSLFCSALRYEFIRAPQLQQLELSSSQLSGLELQQLLRELCVSGCPLTSLDLSPLSHLTTLTIKGAAPLTHLDLGPVISTLNELWLIDCPQLVRVSGLQQCTALKWLEIERCSYQLVLKLPRCLADDGHLVLGGSQVQFA